MKISNKNILAWALFALIAFSPKMAFATAPRLLNISSRSTVTSDPMIAGFVTGKGTPGEVVWVIIRACGPLLGQFLSGELKDPVLELYQGNKLLYVNDDWGTFASTSAMGKIFASVGALPFSVDSLDAVMVVPLSNDTAYSAVVKSADGVSGIALVEVYEFQPDPNRPNTTPHRPVASVTASTSVGVPLIFSISAYDADGDMVQFEVDWNNDGVGDEWTEFGIPGSSLNVAHTWSTAGTYKVRVLRTRDYRGAVSILSSTDDVFAITVK